MSDETGFKIVLVTFLLIEEKIVCFFFLLIQSIV